MPRLLPGPRSRSRSAAAAATTAAVSFAVGLALVVNSRTHWSRISYASRWSARSWSRASLSRRHFSASASRAAFCSAVISTDSPVGMKTVTVLCQVEASYVEPSSKSIASTSSTDDTVPAYRRSTPSFAMPRLCSTAPRSIRRAMTGACARARFWFSFARWRVKAKSAVPSTPASRACSSGSSANASSATASASVPCPAWIFACAVSGSVSSWSRPFTVFALMPVAFVMAECVTPRSSRPCNPSASSIGVRSVRWTFSTSMSSSCCASVMSCAIDAGTSVSPASRAAARRR